MTKYYIASLKHTHKHSEHIVFWGTNHSGYTQVVAEHAGTYTLEEAVKLNDGVDTLAVPVEAVRALLSPEPYYKVGARLYDQRGPVVDNSRKNWNLFTKNSLARGLIMHPAPETFRGTKRTIQIPTTWQPIATAPTDGTRVWLYGGKVEPMVSESYANTEGVKAACFDLREGWSVCNTDYYEVRVTNPTHWMALPVGPV